MSATCFPFGGPEDIERQLIELKEKTDGTLLGAIAFSDTQLEQQMQEFRSQP